MGRRAAAGLLVWVMVGVLTACTGSDDGGAAGTPSVSPPPVQEGPSGEIQEVPELDEGWEGVLADVTVDSCPTEAGQVTATGTVVNSAGEPRDIAIAISWNAPDSTDSLMQLAVTEQDVPPGETVDWSVSGDLPADAGQCVVLARSGTLADG